MSTSRAVNKPIKVVAFIRSLKQTGISAINYYRAYAPLVALGRGRRFATQIMDQTKLKRLVGSGLSGVLLNNDLYVVSRLFAGREGRAEFIQAIHDSGGTVVFDTDDDLTDEYRELGRGEDFLGILRAVDAVTVSTPHLGKQLAKYTRVKPYVLPNHVDVDWFAESSQKAERQVNGLTIGFVGTASHYDDWKYPVKALARLARECDVTIVAAGYVPEYLQELPNLVELRPVPYALYPGMMRQFDVVCATLDPEDEFNKSKSSIKALEAMAAARVIDKKGRVGGAVVVATDMPVYRRAMQHRHNGLLVNNDEWYDALSLLVRDTRLRNNLAVSGHRWIKKNRDIAIGCQLWQDAYLKILGRRAL